MGKDFGLDLVDEEAEKPQISSQLLSAVRPRSSPRPIVDTRESDRKAAESGFTSREPVALAPTEAYLTPRKQRRKQEVTTPLSMRVPRSVHVRFLEFSEEHVLSYPRALEKLLNDSELLKRLERKGEVG